MGEVEGNFREALAAAYYREQTRSFTAVGPHRDDFSLAIDGVDMGMFASRGQARTLALTLRLAEAEFLTSVRGDGPVVLFDDAFSEIDAARRQRLLEKSLQYEQVLITTTDLEQVKDFLGPRANYLRVDGGHIWQSDEHGNVEKIPVSGEGPEEDESTTIDGLL